MDHEEHRKRYEINRRKFMKLAGAGGLAALSSTSLFGLGSVMPVHAQVTGENAAERAINAAKALKKKMKGDTLNLQLPAGSEGQFIKAQPWWEEATGIKIKIMIVPLAQNIPKAMNVAVTKSSKFDLLFVSPYGLPDLIEAKLAMDVTGYAKKYNPELVGENGVIEPLYLFGMYKGKLYGLICDADVNSLYIRRDWLEDTDNQKAFEDKFGYPLRQPTLYGEYFDQIKFFTNPQKGTFGTWIYASPFYAKWEYLRLLTTKRFLPFDQDMRPQITSPTGIATLEELVGLKDYFHPACFTGGWDHAFKAYVEGTIWCTMTWPALIKYSNLPGYSKIVGKVKICPVPGYKQEGGSLFRPCHFTYGFSYTISRYSKNPEIAYLYAQWMHSPTVSFKIVPTAEGGFIDPYRYNHMTEALLSGYDPEHWQEVKEALMTNIQNSYPEIALKGGEEYMSTLDRNVIAAFQGVKKPEQALKETAEQWEKITERFGREGQKNQWNFLTSSYGPSLRKAMNLPEPPAWVKKLG